MRLQCRRCHSYHAPNRQCCFCHKPHAVIRARRADGVTLRVIAKLANCSISHVWKVLNVPVLPDDSTH